MSFRPLYLAQVTLFTIAMEGMQSWEEQKGSMSADFHLAERVDPAESLAERYGLEEAIEILLEKMKENPSDPETRRQTALLLKQLDEKLQPLRKQISN